MAYVTTGDPNKYIKIKKFNFTAGTWSVLGYDPYTNLRCAANTHIALQYFDNKIIVLYKDFEDNMKDKWLYDGAWVNVGTSSIGTASSSENNIQF